MAGNKNKGKAETMVREYQGVLAKGLGDESPGAEDKYFQISLRSFEVLGENMCALVFREETRAEKAHEEKNKTLKRIQSTSLEGVLQRLESLSAMVSKPAEQVSRA